MKVAKTSIVWYSVSQWKDWLFWALTFARMEERQPYLCKHFMDSKFWGYKQKSFGSLTALYEISWLLTKKHWMQFLTWIISIYLFTQNCQSLGLISVQDECMTLPRKNIYYLSTNLLLHTSEPSHFYSPCIICSHDD